MAHRRPIVILASDHAGHELKLEIKGYLDRSGYETRDLGAFSCSPSDYPRFILPAAEAVASSKGGAVGIVFGGSGIGECIAANKVKGARAALAYDSYTARMSREHNDSNILCLGGRTATGSAALAKRIVGLWLKTPFSGAKRHIRRIAMISRYERAGRRKGARKK